MGQATKRRLILYTPHDLQLAFHNSKARFRVAASGRQWGKSTMSNNELVSRAWCNPNTKYWFLSPIYSQSRDQYRKLVNLLPQDVIKRKSDTELSVQLINDSVIEYKSGETLDRLRGATIHGAILDEVRDHNPELWPMVIRPMLTTTKGWCAFTSTPNGYDAFYDIAERARLDMTGEWAFFRGPSTGNPLFTEEEYNAAKREMSEPIFAQEILAEFRDLARGKAYVNFSDANIKDQNPFAPIGQDYSPHLPIVLAPDFNLSPMAWGIGQLKPHENLWYWNDEIRLESSHTQEAALEFISWYKEHCPGGWGPGLIICGDATSKAGQRAAAGQSDYDILETMLKSNGIRFVNSTPDSNPMVKDRVNTMNTFFRNAEGTSKQWVHPRCKYIIKDMQRVTWKENSNNTLDEGSSHELTHSSDGPGYAVCQLTPLKGVQQVGIPRVRRF
jgi:hypothetical protein